MGRIKVRHLIAKPSGYYWQPGKAARAAGMHPEALGRDLASAVERAEYLNGVWDAIKYETAAPRPMPEGSVGWLIKDYERSSWYARLGERTQENVDRQMAVINKALGSVPVKGIERRHCRRLHDKLTTARGESQANECLKVLRRLLNYSIEVGLREVNPAAKMNLRHGPPRRVVWAYEEVCAFRTMATEMGHPAWALAVQLGYDTAQRLGDILAATWNDLDGDGMTFRQSKTGATVWVPLSADTLAMLTGTERRAVQIITGDVRGLPIRNRSYFARVFREIRDAAGLRAELTFRDLRRTAASEVLAGGGRAEPLTGHRPGSPVLRVYETPSREAARSAQAARRRIHERKSENGDS